MILADLAARFAGEVVGDSSINISSVCTIQDGAAGAIAFLANPKYATHLSTTTASAVFVQKGSDVSSPAAIVFVDDPYVAFVKTIAMFNELPTPFEGVAESAVIHETAKIGANAAIAPFVYIGKNVSIGKNALIYPNTVIMDNTTIGDDARIYANVSIREETRIGDRVTIHANASIGTDGFGFAPNLPEGKLEKIYQIGRVVLGNDVEVGSNTCVDRAAIGETVVADGTKLDNLVQIGHGVKVGNNNALAAYTGISGSTEIGDWNMFGGKAATTGHIKIGNQNQFAAASYVTNNVGDGKVLMGRPHREAAEYRRIVASETRLPQIIKEVRDLKKQVEELKKQQK